MEWIPVRERVPDNIEFPANYIGILVSIKGDVFMAYRYGDCWCIAGSGVVFNSYLDGVDAWIPVPKPYEEVK